MDIRKKGVCIKCTPYLASCVVQIELGSDRPMVWLYSASASCLRACFFHYGAFEYACYNMSDYWVSGKEKESGRLRSHHTF